VEELTIFPVCSPFVRCGRLVNPNREDAMHRNRIAGILGTVTFMLLYSPANASDFSAKFSGFQELGALGSETGAIFSPGKAKLDLDLNRKTRVLRFKLTYSGFPSSTTVTVAHRREAS
jgi:hypothetical protein